MNTENSEEKMEMSYFSALMPKFSYFSTLVLKSSTFRTRAEKQWRNYGGAWCGPNFLSPKNFYVPLFREKIFQTFFTLKFA